MEFKCEKIKFFQISTVEGDDGPELFGLDQHGQIWRGYSGKIGEWLWEPIPMPFKKTSATKTPLRMS